MHIVGGKNARWVIYPLAVQLSIMRLQVLEHPSAGAQPAALLELWPLVAVVWIGAAYATLRRPSATARSPGMLQRLLL